MKISDGVVETDLETEILQEYLKKFQDKYGEDFQFKKDGVLEYLLKIAAGYEKNLQENIKYLATQFDTTKTEGVWQDLIFSRIGFKRLMPKFASFFLTLAGDGGQFVQKNSVVIRESSSGEEFYNSEDFCFDDDCECAVKFVAKNFGNISINSSSNFSIVTAPNSVKSVLENSLNDFINGDFGESDDNFRTRYATNKCIPETSTADAIFATLSQYTDCESYLKILSKKNYQHIVPGCVQIIAKPNVSDEVFAEKIFETVADGIGLIGEIEVPLKDNTGTPVLIKFSKAIDVPIGVNISITVSGDEILGTEIVELKRLIADYLISKKYGLEATIYASEIIVSLAQTKVVKNLVAVSVYRLDDGAELNKIKLGVTEIPDFSAENINIEVLNT